MTFQFVGASQGLIDLGTFFLAASSCTVQFPAGTQVGDLAILHIAQATKADRIGQEGQETYIGGVKFGVTGWNRIFSDEVDTNADQIQRLMWKHVTPEDLAAPYVVQANIVGYEDGVYNVGVYRGVRFQEASVNYHPEAAGFMDIVRSVRAGMPVVMSTITATGFGSGAVDRIWFNPAGFTSRFYGGTNKAKWHLADFVATESGTVLFSSGTSVTTNSLAAILFTPYSGGWHVGSIAGG